MLLYNNVLFSKKYYKYGGIMQEQMTRKSHLMLFFNTVAFTVCFAVWMLNGVLITFLTSNQLYEWGPITVGWLMGIPVLTGAIFRLPAGILTDKYGGKYTYTILLFLCAIPMYLLSFADSTFSFMLCSFGFGLSGTSFSIGIAFSSVWYPKKNQGFALGIFGAGNAGAALTSAFAPTLLNMFTKNGTYLEGWRMLPKFYTALLIIMGILFLIFTENKKPKTSNKSIVVMLEPLSNIRVWRLGIYYFLVFGCFVAFANWLVPYFVNVYFVSLTLAGMLAASFSFPSGVIRALGGYLSDLFGARSIMYWVLGLSVCLSFFLIIPRMEIYSAGRGIMSKFDGIVEHVSDTQLIVNGFSYNIKQKSVLTNFDASLMILPSQDSWHEVLVKEGDHVSKKQLLAKGITRIFFQANMWIFAVLVILLGSIWGIGKAAVYKHIPDYFPEQVGVVGGMVGVLGGLGGFLCPIIFGYCLDYTGLWTSCWVFMFLLSLICLIWMHFVIKKLDKEANIKRLKNMS